MIHHFIDLRVPIILAEKLLTIFGSCLHGGLQRSKFPFIYKFLLGISLRDFCKGQNVY